MNEFPWKRHDQIVTFSLKVQASLIKFGKSKNAKLLTCIVCIRTFLYGQFVHNNQEVVTEVWSNKKNNKFNGESRQMQYLLHDVIFSPHTVDTLNWVPLLTISVCTNTRLQRTYFPLLFITAMAMLTSSPTTSNFLSKVLNVLLVSSTLQCITTEDTFSSFKV